MSPSRQCFIYTLLLLVCTASNLFASDKCDGGSCHASPGKKKAGGYNKMHALRVADADALLAAGDYRNALAAYNKLLRGKNDNAAPLHHSRAYASAMLGDHSGALRDYNMAIRLSPRAAHLYFSRGTTRMMSGNAPEKALEDFTTAISLKEDYMEAYYSRASVYYQRGNYANAIKDFSKVIDLRPELMEPWYARGIAHHKAGQHRLAVDDFSQAIKINPTMALLYAERAQSYEALGDLTGQQQDLRKVKEIPAGKERSTDK